MQPVELIDQAKVEEDLGKLSGVEKSYPYEKGVAVYSYNDEMFALLIEGSKPVRISLRCDRQLAQLLRDRYETVMAGEHLDKNNWNTLILTGQLSWQEVHDLIRHAYELVKTN